MKIRCPLRIFKDASMGDIHSVKPRRLSIAQRVIRKICHRIPHEFC